MAGQRCGRAVRVLLGGLGLSLALAGFAPAQNPNERDIKPAPNIQDVDEIFDKDGNPKADSKVWVLDFRFKPLRSIKVNVPGRGEQVVYYLWYQVINKTPSPHTVVPNIELVTHDTHMTYKDEILPTVLDQIAELEGPRGQVRSTNSIARDPIPALKKNALPRAITGLAIWTDPNEPRPGDSKEVRERKAKMPKLSDSNSFSIYIAGLSNGWAETDAPDGGNKTVVRRKTLQLKFRRYGDGSLRRDEDIQYIGHEWLYRASSLEIPKDDQPMKPGKPDVKPPMKQQR